MAISMVSRVSVTVPIWFSLMRMELATPSAMPSARMEGLVTNTSSPTSWVRSPRLAVSMPQPSQSLSAMPSSMEMMGYLSTSFSQ